MDAWYPVEQREKKIAVLRELKRHKRAESQAWPVRGLLLLGIMHDANHGRTQQPVPQLVARLQLFQYVVLLAARALDHLNRLVDMRVKRLALGRDRLQSQLAHCVV